MQKRKNDALKKVFSLKNIIISTILIIVFVGVFVGRNANVRIFKNSNEPQIKAKALPVDSGYFDYTFWNSTNKIIQQDDNCYAYAICKAMERNIYENYREVVSLRPDLLINAVNAFKARWGLGPGGLESWAWNHYLRLGQGPVDTNGNHYHVVECNEISNLSEYNIKYHIINYGAVTATVKRIGC